MSIAEIVAATVAAFLAAVPIVAYLIDAAGLGLMPGVVLAASIAIAAAMAWSLRVGVKPGWCLVRRGWRGPGVAAAHRVAVAAPTRRRF